MSKTDCYTCKRLNEDAVCDMGGNPSFLKENCRYYEPKRRKPTNFDRIKAMSVEEIAKWLNAKSNCSTCANENCNGMGDCEQGHLLWLQQEADND